MKPYFYIDGSDLMCELGAETYKLGELQTNYSLNSFVDLYELNYLEELYGQVGFTQDILDEAIRFGVNNGYSVK
jgi:hypothetical protein